MDNFLSTLPQVTAKSKKRLGRGPGSGKGSHTVGRGQKGQKARTKIHPAFMGTKVKKSLLQRLPLMRGKGKFKSLQSKPVLITLDMLNGLKKGTLVTEELLVEQGLIKAGDKAKVVANGEISQVVTVQLPTSQSARLAIEKAGGEVVE